MGAEPSLLLDLKSFSLQRRVPGGSLHLLQDIDLRVQRGQWVTVVGANGSGKSSLLKYLAGEDSPLAGRTSYMAQDPDDQILATTVLGEITMGRGHGDAARILSDFTLAPLADLDPRLLSAGQKQRLAFAVAVANQPELLICDEPTSLQDSEQSAWVLDRLDRWRAQTGGTLLTATCDRAEASRADWLVILQGGRISAQGPREDLLDSELSRALLVGEADRNIPYGVSPHVSGEPVLTLQDIGCGFLGPGGGISGIDLKVARGERVGLTGPNGCGKSTLLAMCAGLKVPERGQVELAGRKLYHRQKCDLDHGLAMLAPQFPEYMFCRVSVLGELELGPLAAGMKGEDVLEMLGLDQGIMDRNPHDLSSGQRRRLAVGMAVHCGRPLVLLDEPTAALDRPGRDQVAAIIQNMSSESALIIASHDREFLRKVGCRILEIRPGEKGLAATRGGC